MNTYSPQMDKTAEQYNYTLMEKVKEILIQANLLEGLQVETVCTVNNLKNRYPYKKIVGENSLECLEIG